MHTYVRKTGPEGCFHLRLNVPWQRPSAGSGAEIHLKRIHSGLALDCRFRLDCAWADRCEGKSTRWKESLYNAASAVASPRVSRSNHRSRNGPKYRRRSHAGILPR
jgi:hypothetical protein